MLPLVGKTAWAELKLMWRRSKPAAASHAGVEASLPQHKKAAYHRLQTLW